MSHAYSGPVVRLPVWLALGPWHGIRGTAAAVCDLRYAAYAHSTGYGFNTTYQKQEDTKDATVNWAQGNKADAFYVSAIAPVIKGKLRAKARYDLYRKSASWSDSKTNYEIGLNYSFNKNIELQTEYVLVDDRSLEKNYSMIDAQLSVKF